QRNDQHECERVRRDHGGPGADKDRNDWYCDQREAESRGGLEKCGDRDRRGYQYKVHAESVQTAPTRLCSICSATASARSCPHSRSTSQSARSIPEVTPPALSRSPASTTLASMSLAPR